MFTGIVEEIGKIKGLGPGRLGIEANKVLKGTKPGDSISISGACLTVTSISDNGFEVEIMAETIRRTNLGRLQYGDRVNLERAVPVDGRFGGHFVQGHVDDVGKVMSLKPEEEAFIARISVTSKLLSYIVIKGFIAMEGVSLTVIDCDDSSFSVSLVGFTRKHTTLGIIRPGDIVNLEVDIMAKYIEKLQQRDNRGVTLDFLEEQGFLRAR
ncbi:MAG: riboflavin synthase [Dehalococcoidia bacterium]|nr:riboflavin synthase [Dehalococcoidia bacterium]